MVEEMAAEDVPYQEVYRQDAIDKAAVQGLIPVYADNRTLQLDIDSAEDFVYATNMLKTFKGFVKPESATFTVSKSGKWHIYVKTQNEIEREDRILLQACLGSDRKREILNWKYLRDGGQNELFFFEKSNGEVIHKEIVI